MTSKPTFALREKHNEYYCCITYRDEWNIRKERWIPLRILTKEDKKREVKRLMEELSAPGAIDLDSVTKTNETLKRLGLFPYDNDWHVIRDGTFGRKKKPGHPFVYLEVPDLEPSQIQEAQLSLKKGAKMYFGDYLVFWFNIHKENIGPNTINTLKSHIFHRIGPWFNAEKITLTGLQPEDIEAFYREKMEEGVGANTIRHFHGTIRSALQYAFRRGYVVYNVADRVERPKKEIYKGSFYNEEELKKLFEVAKGTNLEFAVYMAAYYGLRREEVCGLKWDAIDFQYKTMTVKHTVIETSVDGQYQLVMKDTTKNRSSFRTLPLSDSTIDKLLKMKKRQEKMKVLFGSRYNSQFEDYIYLFENGNLVHPNWVSCAFRRLLDDNGMRRIRFHDLRHSCATLLRHQGVPMEDIAKWLGHSNILTTEQIYAHYDESLKGNTLKALSDALDPKKPKKEME